MLPLHPLQKINETNKLQEQSFITMSNPNAVLISNVDDYLAPSQACINPLYNNSSTDDTQSGEKEEKKSAEAANVVVPKVRKRRPRVSASNNSEGPAIPSVSETKKDPIKASMADCLACSGCVTTAETVLLEQNHSLTALKNVIQQSAYSQKTFVATISPAVWADLLRHFNVPANEKQLWQKKLVTALQRVLNVSYVMDGNIPLQWSLLESGEEFCRAYVAKHQQQQPIFSDIQQLDEHETPSVAMNASETQYMLPDGATKIVNTQQALQQIQPKLPLLTSSCPALVCLVEKSTHSAVRHLSKSKSPMSMAGAFWRRYHSHSTDQIFHLAIMPCHDKKLEASRKDFANFATNQQDVDMVLTTQEWLHLMANFLQQNEKSEGEWSKEEATQKVREFVESLPPAQATTETSNNILQNNHSGSGEGKLLLLAQHQDTISNTDDAMEVDDADPMNGSVMELEKTDTKNTADTNTTFTPYGSGGLAEFVFRYAALRLFNYHVNKVDWKPIMDKSVKAASARMQRVARNRDYYQATLFQNPTTGQVSTEELEGSVPVLNFAIAYGLQTVQRVLEPFGSTKSSSKQQSRQFDFIEAMACPSGCLNGGGQLRVADRETPTQTRQRVSSTREYFESAILSTESLPQQVLPAELRQTRFHVVPPLVFSMGAVKGVDVKDTQW